MKRNRKRCYHWVIAGVALLVMFVQLGIVNNPSGIFTGIFLAMPSVAAIVANPLANAVRVRKNFEEA